MRRVFSSHDEVCHVWASLSQEEGRAGNIFFENRSIYSYGHHYEAARFITDEIVVMNPDRFSPSTGQHLNKISSAVRHKTVFTVPNFNIEGTLAISGGAHKENLEFLYENYESAVKAAKNARKYDKTDFVMRSARRMREYADTMSCVSLLTAEQRRLYDALHEGPPRYADGAVMDLAGIDPDHTEVLRARRERANQQEAERHARRREERRRFLEDRRVFLTEEREKWIAGGSSGYTRQFNGLLGISLRVKGEMVETSMGARVPLQQAIALYRLARHIRNSEGIRYDRRVNPVKIGYYTLTLIRDNGDTKVGCHDLAFEEMQRLAIEVGVEDQDKIAA